MRLLMRFTLAAFLAAFAIWPQADAQYANTYYYMYGVPQANQLNPAFQSGCNGYLGMPFLSPIRFQIESNSITYGDIFQWSSSLNKYITFMHPEGDKQKFLDALKPSNRIRSEAATSFLSAGWRKEEWFFTLDFNERIVEGTSFSKDLAEFLIYGNLHQSNFNFSDLAQNLSYFHQLAIGISYNLDDEMQFGIRAKLLLGGQIPSRKTRS
jgi:hypothetical protein